MKKVFSFLAVLCCTMFFTAKAVLPSDGVIINVGDESLSHEDCGDWQPAGLVGGTISYDEENHVLTLNTAMISRGIRIDASANGGFDVTVRVIGVCVVNVSSDDEECLHYMAGKGLILEGDKDGELFLQISNSTTGYGAILCAANKNYSSLTEEETYPLTIRGGVSVMANALWASGNGYAVYCHDITIDNSWLYANSVKGSGKDAIQTKGYWGDSNNLIGAIWWSYDDAYESMSAIPCAKVYPVVVDYCPLNESMSSINNQWLGSIKSGSISYDAETRTLYLDGVEADSKRSNPLIEITDDGTGQPVNIVVLSSSSLTVQEHYPVLSISAPVVLDIRGRDLEMISYLSSTISIDNANLVIRNSTDGLDLKPADAESAFLKVQSKTTGYGIKGENGSGSETLTISHCNISVEGAAGAVYSVTTTEQGVKLDDSHKWNSDHDAVLKGDELAKDEVLFSLDEWHVTGSAWPEGKGSVSLEVDGSAAENPYYFTNDIHVDATPKAVAGWQFVCWEDNSTSVPRSEMVTPSSGSREFVAEFGVIPTSAKQWYCIVDDLGEHKIFKYNDQFMTKEAVAKIEVLSDTYVCSAFANGFLYYIMSNSLGTELTLCKASFDGTTLGTPVVLLSAYTDYNSFDDFKYSPADDCFYGACHRESDYAYVLVKIDVTDDSATITELAEFPISGQLNCMTITSDGTIYAISSDDKLCIVSFDGSLVQVNEIGDIVSPFGLFHSMGYDDASEELFVLDKSWSWRADKSTTSIEPVYVSSLYISDLFSIGASANFYTISVEVATGQDTWGTAYLPGGVTSAKFKEDANVILTAKPAKGYRFKQWSDNSKDEVHEITVTEDKTYTASFEEDPDFTYYNVFVGDEQFYTGRLTMTKEDNTAIKSGSVSYDPVTQTVMLNAVEIVSPVQALRVGDADDEFDATIIVNGTCNLKGHPSYTGMLIYGKDSVLLKGGTDNPTLTLSPELSFHVDLKISGLNFIINGNDWGIRGAQLNMLSVVGANLTVKGVSDITICNLAAVEYKYCSVTPSDILDTEGNIRIYNYNVCDDSNTPWKGDIVFTALPKLSVRPYQEGTAQFKLESDDEVFGDGEGFFAPGTKVTITPKAASNFKFARWMDDVNWTDKDLKIPAKREFTMPSGDKELAALFYLEPESDADWFGVNGDEFIRFGFGDNAAKVARATNTLVDFNAGDWFDGRWVYVEGVDVKSFPFGGTLKDGSEISGKVTDYNDESISGVTDMSYDLSADVLYAVAGNKLYRITTKENKEIATFKLDGVETTVVAIAIDADGIKYALTPGVDGKLYTFTVSGDEAKLKIVGKKENDSKIGESVTTAPQSMTFDAQTGELFWGAADYIRLIDINKMKTFIVGDLGQKGGLQGNILSMHRMVEMVEITAQVADDQEEWGTVTMNGETSTIKNPYVSATLVEGTPVTIEAEANEGYHFVEWTYLDGSKEKSFKGNDSEQIEVEAEEITYIAYFEEDLDGIENIVVDSNETEKRLVDGTIYILRNGNIYTVTGEKVK